MVVEKQLTAAQKRARLEADWSAFQEQKKDFQIIFKSFSKHFQIIFNRKDSCGRRQKPRPRPRRSLPSQKRLRSPPNRSQLKKSPTSQRQQKSQRQRKSQRKLLRKRRRGRRDARSSDLFFSFLFLSLRQEDGVRSTLERRVAREAEA